jgi:hypothetical protein
MFLALLFINFDDRVPLSALIPYSVKIGHHRFIERTSSKDRIPRIRQERNVCSFGREYIMCHTCWYFPKDGASRRRCSVLWLGGGGWEIVAFFNRNPMYCQNKISKRKELMVAHSLFVNCISSLLTALSHLNQTQQTHPQLPEYSCLLGGRVQTRAFCRSVKLGRLLVLVLWLGVVARSFVDGPTSPDTSHTRHGLMWLRLLSVHQREAVSPLKDGDTCS